MSTLDIDAAYPFLNDGLQFLRDKQVLDGKAYAKLSQAQKLSIFGSATIASAGQAAQLKQLVVAAAKSGADEATFAQTIQGQVDILRSDANRILRTNTKQHYIEGMTQTLEKPHIQDAFPYVMFVATHDGRTRHAHAEHDGQIVLVGSDAYDQLKKLLGEWNCRCSLIPLTAKQAKARGVDVPSEYLEPQFSTAS